MADLSTRAATSADADQIKQLALDNQMFEPDEMGDFDEMLAGFFDGTLEDHHWIVAEIADDAGTMAAAAYYAPEPFADRMWNLYFLATAPNQHGTGAGTTLIERVEAALRGAWAGIGSDVDRRHIESRRLRAGTGVLCRPRVRRGGQDPRLLRSR